jgi:hypothetical protein
MLRSGPELSAALTWGGQEASVTYLPVGSAAGGTQTELYPMGVRGGVHQRRGHLQGGAVTERLIMSPGRCSC